MQKAIGEAERLMIPLTGAELIAGIARLEHYGQTFNIPYDPEALELVYRQMCVGFPADLFEYGLALVLDRWTDTFRLPMPGHISTAVEEAWKRRRGNLIKLQMAYTKGTRDGFPAIEPPAHRMNDEDWEAWMQKVRANLNTVTARTSVNNRK